MNTHLFMPFFRVSLFRSLSAFPSWKIGITLKKTPIVTGWVIHVPNSILSCENANPNGEAGNVSDLAEKLGHKPSYVTRILSLNNLAPDIVESILAGTEPDGLSIEKLTRQPIPEDWNEPRRLYGFPKRGSRHRLFVFSDGRRGVS